MFKLAGKSEYPCLTPSRDHKWYHLSPQDFYQLRRVQRTGCLLRERCVVRCQRPSSYRASMITGQLPTRKNRIQYQCEHQWCTTEWYYLELPTLSSSGPGDEIIAGPGSTDVLRCDWPPNVVDGRLLGAARLYADGLLHKDCSPVGLHPLQGWLSVVFCAVEDCVDLTVPILLPVPLVSDILSPSGKSKAVARMRLVAFSGSGARTC